MSNKSKGINKTFLYITASFRDIYEKASEDIGLAILTGSLVTKKLIEKKVVKILTPIINEYFADSIAASNKIVPAHISKLTDQLSVPFKYNKTLLDTINEKSVWTGYYDPDVKSGFSKTQITRMKKVILTGKYSNWDEKTLIAGIKNVTKGTDRSARLIARMETARLDSAANKIYYGKKAVRDEYDLVWSQNSDYDRHRGMDGKVADENGMYVGLKGELVPGPPYQSSPFNCLCSEIWVPRSK